MKKLRFKRWPYKHYAPILFKLFKLKARLDLKRWGFKAELLNSLAQAYWNKYLSKQFLKEIRLDGGQTYDGKPIKRTSDKAFVLACGTSINSITTEEWAFIAKHYSVGLNAFFVHEFTPSAYFSEFSDNDLLYELTYEYLLNNAERENVDVYLSAYFVVVESTKYVNPSVAKPIFYAADRLRIDDIDLLMKIVKEYYQCGQVVALSHQVSNLDVAINYCVGNGFKDIYLVGVDLNDSLYFWEQGNSPAYNKATEYIVSQREGLGQTVEKAQLHSTASDAQGKSLGRLNIVDYLYYLQDRVLTDMGVQLYVTNPSSLLAEKLPVETLAAMVQAEKS